jgi:hypothetical protein
MIDSRMMQAFMVGFLANPVLWIGIHRMLTYKQ